MKINKQKRKVILCGTQYGQAYLPTINESENYELTGLLAKGSDRSVRLSEQYGVPLYSAHEEIVEDFDLAIVAINEKVGVPIADCFLKKNIPVLIEHPIGMTGLNTLIQSSEANQTVCHINSHFTDLPSVKDFIGLYKQLNKISQPYVVNFVCNSRTLFSTLDIMLRCGGNSMIERLDINWVGSNRYYANCNFLLNGLPCSLIYQNWRGEIDNSQDSPLGHHIVATFPQGTLTLVGTFGPTLWSPLMAAGAPQGAPNCSQSSANNIDIVDIVQWRKDANLTAMSRLMDCFILYGDANDHIVPPYQAPQFLTQLCSFWNMFTAKLGPAVAKPCEVTLPSDFWLADEILNRVSN